MVFLFVWYSLPSFVINALDFLSCNSVSSPRVSLFGIPSVPLPVTHTEVYCPGLEPPWDYIISLRVCSLRHMAVYT